MGDRGEDLLIRGHDHWIEHAYQTPEGEIHYNLLEPGESVPLEKDYRHIITHGPWYDDIYATIEDGEEPVLSYHRPKN
jgi:hypothetical protein